VAGDDCDCQLLGSDTDGPETLGFDSPLLQEETMCLTEQLMSARKIIQRLNPEVHIYNRQSRWMKYLVT
jgi:hypothetical protein